ncbi:MAG: hypothetical protein JSV39_00490 [Candidatus Aenigmatarchaeota archaeon]|nr:MAG: hypothetical protein JSV39_00490 [Candidatus Aenigmarchaeota archaeon]
MIWWLIFKIMGLVMIAVGGFLVIFLPGIQIHQEAGSGKAQHTSIGLGGIVLGLILIIVGGFILFSP